MGRGGERADAAGHGARRTRPSRPRGQELAQIDLIVDPVPDQLHLVGQVVLLDQASQVEIPTGRGARSGEPREADVVRVWRKRRSPVLSVSTMAADRRRIVVDDGNRPVAGSGESAQSFDLGGDNITRVAGLVHVEKVGVESNPQVSPQGVQRAQRVDAHPLGAIVLSPTKVELWS